MRGDMAPWAEKTVVDALNMQVICDIVNKLESEWHDAIEDLVVLRMSWLRWVLLNILRTKYEWSITL
jgi:hypothetical protein